jgi:hypothetical protein
MKIIPPRGRSPHRHVSDFLPLSEAEAICSQFNCFLMDLVDRALEATAMDAIDALRVFFLLAAATVSDSALFRFS